MAASMTRIHTCTEAHAIACIPARTQRWVWELARSTGFTLNLTLVNTPFMVQHHPWLAFHHGAFSNASIVLHELKNPSSPGWAFAAKQGNGAFIPFERTCGPCGAPTNGRPRGSSGMGWVTTRVSSTRDSSPQGLSGVGWAEAKYGTGDNPVARWLCCGASDGSCGEWRPPGKSKEGQRRPKKGSLKGRHANRRMHANRRIHA